MREVRAQGPAVDERRQIAVRGQYTGACTRNRDERHRRPVRKEARRGDDDLRSARCSLGEPRDHDVDDRDALEHAEEGEGRPHDRGLGFDGIQQQSQPEQQNGPPEDVTADESWHAAASRQRDGHCGSHREQEKRKHEVGGRPAIPRGVIERPVDRVPGTGGADQDHRGHSEAAKDVERFQTLAGRHALRLLSRSPDVHETRKP